MLKVVRSPDGRVVSGSLGPAGRAGSHRTQMQRMIDAQLAEAMKTRESAAEFVEDACHAIENPKDDPAFTALVLNRVWPAVTQVEHSGADGGPIEVTSAGEWSRLCEIFGDELPSLAEAAPPRDDAPTDPGA